MIDTTKPERAWFRLIISLMGLLILINVVSADDYNITACMNLTLPNSVYYVRNNVNNSMTCFNISANNVTIDCMNNVINYSRTGVIGYGIFSNMNYTTVRNCKIGEGITTNNNKHAILCNGCYWGQFINNNITTIAQSYGIYYSSRGINTTIFNNSISTYNTNGIGIYLTTNSNNNRIINNTILTRGTTAYGILLAGTSNNNLVANNTIETRGSTAHGIYLNAPSNYNNFDNNFINVTNIVANGINIYRSINSNFTNNKIFSYRRTPIYLDGNAVTNFNHFIPSNNLADNKPINFTRARNGLTFDSINFTQYGQVIFANMKGLVIRNSSFNNNGLTLADVNDSIIDGNSFDGKGVQIYLDMAQRNNITNNIISTSDICQYSHGIYLYQTSNNNNLFRNLILTRAINSYGLYINTITNGNVINNSISTQGQNGYGMYVYISSRMNFENLSILTKGSAAYGINYYRSNEITMSKIKIYTENVTTAYGLYMQSLANNLTIIDSTINATRVGDIMVFTDLSANSFLRLINVTFNQSNSSINDPDLIMDVRYYLDIKVSDALGPLNASLVNISYQNNSRIYSYISDSNGYISRVNLSLYTQSNSSKNYLPLYIVNVTKANHLDYENNSINISGNKFLEITMHSDIMPISIQSLYPINNSSSGNETIKFNFNISSIKNVTNCMLLINNSIVSTNTTIDKDIVQSFEVPVSQGDYLWSINCTNTQNYTNSSEVRKITIIPTYNFDGKTTDLSLVNIEDIPNLIIEKSSFGFINFTENINLSGGTNLNSFVHISYNLISIDSENIPQLNKSARLSLINLSFQNPIIFKNNITCQDCTILSNTIDELIFEVSSFSSYSASENSLLAIWDDSDFRVKRERDQNKFYANYSNTTSGNIISGPGIYCNITVNDTINQEMTFNSTTNLYEYTKTFDIANAYLFQIICDGLSQGFSVLNSSDFASIESYNGPLSPEQLDKIDSQRHSYSTKEEQSIAGNLSELSVLAYPITKSWQGYYGKISKLITLEDASGSKLYSWDLGIPQGEILATRAFNVNFVSVNCTTESQIYAEEIVLGQNSADPDSVNNTFSQYNHNTFSIGDLNFTADSCRSINTYVNNLPQEATFQEVLLSDGASNIVYTALIDDNQIGFNGINYDFQMLVGENGHDDEYSTTTYYFFIELN